MRYFLCTVSTARRDREKRKRKEVPQVVVRGVHWPHVYFDRRLFVAHLRRRFFPLSFALLVCFSSGSCAVMFCCSESVFLSFPFPLERTYVCTYCGVALCCVVHSFIPVVPVVPSVSDAIIPTGKCSIIPIFRFNNLS